MSEIYEQHSLGTVLRDYRQSQNRSLEEVAKGTRIRLIFLEALEEDRYDLLPGKAYVSGFVKSYSRFIGLDGEALLREFADEIEASWLEETNYKAESVMTQPLEFTPKKKSAHSQNTVLWGVISVIALASLVWMFWGGPQPEPPTEVTTVEDPVGVHEEAPLQTPEVVEDERLPNKPEEAIVEVVPKPLPEAAVLEEQTIPEPAKDKAEVSVTPTTFSSAPEVLSLPIKKSGSVIKMKAHGEGSLSLQIDKLQKKNYRLKEDMILSWKIHKHAVFNFEKSGPVQIWMDNQEVALQGALRLAVGTPAEGQND
jgi:cytoskeletal protein RodZ